MRDLESGRGAGDGGRPRAVLIAGPTASGKSALALELAERHRGIVINADSMQVYDGLRILTARPSADETARAPHLLYGHVAPSERHTVARWRDDAAAAIAAAEAAGLLPILTGGTGLYFKALTEGLAAVPPIPDDLRDALAGEAERQGIPALHARLARHDPGGAARLSPNDRTRVLRALEVVEATGRTLATWQQEPGLPPLLGPAETKRLVLEPERALLYGRIDRRFEAMVAEGALDEVAALLALVLDPSLPAMKAIGVRELGGHLAGRTALSEAIERSATETRRYAKRQGTWFRNQMADWPRAAAAEAGLLLLEA